MAAADTLQIINHYKRDIEKITIRPERALKYEDRLLHCIGKLHKLPVTVNHLQVTGVGKTVNALRKIQGKKGISEAAKALVAKWKNMVIEEDLEAERKTKELEESQHQENVNYDTSYSPQSSLNNVVLDSGTYSPSKIGSEKRTSDGYTPGNPNGIEILCYSPTKKSDLKVDKSQEINNQKTEEQNASLKSSSKREKDRERRGEKSSHSSKSHRHESKTKSSHSSTSKSSSSSGGEKSSKHGGSGSSKRAASDDDADQAGPSFADALGPMIIKKSSGGSSKKKIKTDEERSSKKLKKEEVPGPSTLEPLDPQMFSNLSVPTPNYKPHPNPVVYSPESSSMQKKEEEDALALMMSNKNTRTKVYSGIKTGLAYVPSLYEICCHVLQHHFDSLEYTGGVPYSLLKPVLDIASPSQLYRFEHYNPYILEDTDELWRFHVKKEFKIVQREDMESWRDMYLRCVDEREAKYKSVTANIQKSIEKSVPVRQTKLAYVEVAKPPRAVLRAQLKNGTSKPDSSRLMGKENPDAVRINPPAKALGPRVNDIPPHLRLKPKVAPLMQKTLKSIKQIRMKR